MKEKIAELRLKLQECAATMSELVEAGVNIEFQVRGNKEVNVKATTNTEFIITSATINQEL